MELTIEPWLYYYSHIMEVDLEIKAAEFKAKCLQLMDDVQKNHEEIVITKHGKPIAKLVPVEERPQRQLFGYLKDVTIIKGDILSPMDEKWEADE